ncbi:hypothetical protein KY337_00670 [Candidatus Woesearchaeota archaeon]|nr:hypothetical protein [Candidatus Woesearchaeota archaeon]
MKKSSMVVVVFAILIVATALVASGTFLEDSVEEEVEVTIEPVTCGAASCNGACNGECGIKDCQCAKAGNCGAGTCGGQCGEAAE